jgi:hypothetical protein
MKSVAREMRMYQRYFQVITFLYIVLFSGLLFTCNNNNGVSSETARIDITLLWKSNDKVVSPDGVDTLHIVISSESPLLKDTIVTDISWNTKKGYIQGVPEGIPITVSIDALNQYHETMFHGIDSVSSTSSSTPLTVTLHKLPPLAPSDLKLDVLHDTAVMVTWHDNTTIEDNFYIERGIGTGSARVIDTTVKDDTSYLDTKVPGNGDYYYKIYAVNDAGRSASDSDRVTLTRFPHRNRAPVLALIGPKTAKVGEQLAFTISATDPDTDKVTYSMSDTLSKLGATLDSLTGEFTWKPDSAAPDSVTGTFFASDSALRDSEQVDFTVTRRAKSNNAELLELTPSAGSFNEPFNSKTTSYSLTLADSVDSILFNAKTQDKNATVTINGKDQTVKIHLPLKVAVQVTILVRAEDDSTEMTYVVTINHIGDYCATLDSLKLSKGCLLVPAFHPYTVYYEARIPADTQTMSIKPAITPDSLPILVKGISVASGAWSSPITVAQGFGDTIAVKVQCVNKDSVIYKIIPNRAFSLRIVKDSGGATTPSGRVDAFAGQPLDIHADPDTGWAFKGWKVESGNASIDDTSDKSTVVSVESNAEIKAYFNRIYYRLTDISDSNGTVKVPDSLPSGIPGEISATPGNGFHFTVWKVTSGSARFGDSTKATTTVTLENGHATIQAVFAPNKYLLKVTADLHGKVTGVDSVYQGVPAAITATSDSGYPFTEWRVVAGMAVIKDPSDSSTTVTLSAGDAEVRAYFTIKRDTIYVDSSAKGANTGLNWRHAFTDLQMALSNADTQKGSVILIARGTYFPATSRRDTSFVLKNHVKMFGGYPSGGGTRDTAIKTIISGEIQCDGNPSNNSYTVIRANDIDSSSLLDGITISYGYSFAANDSVGGGIELRSSSMKLNNCVFTKNNSRSKGGALWIEGGAPIITNCRFIDNHCTDNNSPAYGGAAGLFKAAPEFSNCYFLNNGVTGEASSCAGAVHSAKSNSHFTGCSFIGNSAVAAGGALLFWLDNSEVVNCLFSRDSCAHETVHWGGGALKSDSSSLLVSGCLFTENVISGDTTSGGAVNLYATSSTFLNCTFFNNKSIGFVYSDDGAMTCHSPTLGSNRIINCTFTQNRSTSNTSTAYVGALGIAGSAVVANCIFWGDVANSNSEIWAKSSAVSIKYCIVKGGYTGPGTLDSIFTADPLLNQLGDNGGPLQTISIPPNSPARNRGTTNLPSGVNLSTDARGQPRSDNRPDIGSFEVQ